MLRQCIPCLSDLFVLDIIKGNFESLFLISNFVQWINTRKIVSKVSITTIFDNLFIFRLQVSTPLLGKITTIIRHLFTLYPNLQCAYARPQSGAILIMAEFHAMHIFLVLVLPTPFYQRFGAFLTVTFSRFLPILLFESILSRLLSSYSPTLRFYLLLIFTLFGRELILTLLYFAQKILPLGRVTFYSLSKFTMTILCLYIVIFN